MAEVPEHLLQRSRERRKALGLPVAGEEAGGGATAPPPDPAAETAPTPAPMILAASELPAETPAGEASAPDAGASKVPAHLLARSAARRAAAGGGAGISGTAISGAGLSGTAISGTAAPGGVATVPTGGAPAAARPAATATTPAPTATGPGGHTQRLLTVVKAGSIQQTRPDAIDKVHTWPHLLVSEFAALLGLMALLVVFSALVRAPLLETADFNRTPNPSKAPWYFLGLQELLTMFNPMVAGVTIPAFALLLLMVAPFIDKNPKNRPADRKFAIAIFTMFLMFWAVLVIIGSFFRGPGFNFILPWQNGVFFDL